MKKKLHKISLILFLLLLIWCVGMAPLSTFVFAVPDAAVIVSLAAFAAAMAAFVLSGEKDKSGGRISAAVIASLLSVGAVFFGMRCNPYSNSVMFMGAGTMTLAGDTELTKEQAKHDLAQEMELLARIHPAFIDGIPENVQANYDFSVKFIDSINKDTITVYEFGQLAESIVSALHDAHTVVNLGFGDENCHYIYDYAKNRTDGYRITGINGMTLADFYYANKELFSTEFESWALMQLEQSANCAEKLKFYGINTNNGVTLTWTSENREFVQEYSAEDFLLYGDYMELNKSYYENRKNDFVSYEISDNYALLALKECNYNNEYITAVRDMFTQVKEKGIQNVILDLRQNGGGNSQVADEFIRYLDIDRYSQGSMKQRLGCFMYDYGTMMYDNQKYDNLLFKGQLYVLTDSGSFSSAMLFPWYLKDNGIGIQIGEVPGNSANGYGETTEFVLDNSKAFLFCSTKIFSRAVPENGDLVVPDIECDGKDALEKAIGLINK